MSPWPSRRPCSCSSVGSERLTVDQEVGGSNPPSCTSWINNLVARSCGRQSFSNHIAITQSTFAPPGRRDTVGRLGVPVGGRIQSLGLTRETFEGGDGVEKICDGTLKMRAVLKLNFLPCGA